MYCILCEKYALAVNLHKKKSQDQLGSITTKNNSHLLPNLEGGL